MNEPIITKIIVEQFDNGISIKWDVNCEPIYFVAEENKEAKTLGDLFFEDIKDFMDNMVTNKVEITVAMKRKEGEV